jgi:hypothetical protein
VNAAGVPNVIAGVPVTSMPAACKALMHSIGSVSTVRGTPFGTGLHPKPVVGCLESAGFRQFATYQPLSRFWAFQSIEAGLFVALAAALVAVALLMVRRRDA